MTILLDTNVLIAAFIARGLCHRLFEHCIRHHKLITSRFILDELREKLIDRFHFSIESVEEAVSLVSSQSEVVEWEKLPGPVCRDAEDDAVLATAVAGRCSVIITGDKDLLTIQRFDGIEIIAPAAFLERESRV